MRKLCLMLAPPFGATPDLSSSLEQDCGMDATPDLYHHYKYHHFFAVSFGLGWGLALYRPFRSLIVPTVLAVFFTIIFEVAGLIVGLPAHTKRCKGPPYESRDAYWGFGFAVFVAVLNLNSYHVYTLSYGIGIIAFAVIGATRKYNSLWNLRDRR